MCKRLVFGVFLLIPGLALADNVVDYGADPTGATDSTAAFRNVAQATLTKLKGVSTPAGLLGSAPRVTIPAGRYLLSDEITFGPYVRVEGEGQPVVTQSDPTKRIFVFDGGADVGLRGVQFNGGTSAVWINNNNVDGSQFRVTDCRFDATSGPAVSVDHSSGTGILSAQLTITGCRWRWCHSALATGADQATLRDSWIVWTDKTAAPPASCCIKLRRGSLRIVDCMLIPVFQDTTPARWIDSRGSLHAERTKFGGEFGGIPIVWHFSVPQNVYPYMGDSITFRDCQLSAGRGTRVGSAIITLDGGLPQTTIFDGNHYLTEVPWIRDAGNLQDYVLPTLLKPDRLRIQTGVNQSWPVAPRIPECLKPFAVP